MCICPISKWWWVVILWWRQEFFIGNYVKNDNYVIKNESTVCFHRCWFEEDTKKGHEFLDRADIAEAWLTCSTGSCAQVNSISLTKVRNKWLELKIFWSIQPYIYIYIQQSDTCAQVQECFIWTRALNNNLLKRKYVREENGIRVASTTRRVGLSSRTYTQAYAPERQKTCSKSTHAPLFGNRKPKTIIYAFHTDSSKL